MSIKKSLGEKVFDTANTLVLILLSLVCLYPMWHVIMAAFSEGKLLMAHSGVLLKPLNFSTAAFGMVLEDSTIIKGYGITIFVVLLGLAVNLFLSSLAAYVMSRKRMHISNFMTKIAVFTMFFSGGMVPLYLTVKNLGLLNNLLALILPQAIVTYNVIILRTGFAAVPDSLEESARIDGANDFTILFTIIVPLAKATVAVIALYYGVSHWNSWFNAMLYIQDRELYPLQLILREILIQNKADDMASGSAQDKAFVAENIKYATIVVATLPILCVYPFIQKYFVKGAMIGAVKG